MGIYEDGYVILNGRKIKVDTNQTVTKCHLCNHWKHPSCMMQLPAGDKDVQVCGKCMTRWGLGV